MSTNSYQTDSKGKISVKQLNRIQQQIQKSPYPVKQNIASSKCYINHIQSQTSESLDNYYQQMQEKQLVYNENRQRIRKRKIFERKVLKATVILPQEKPKNNYNLNNQFGSGLHPEPYLNNDQRDVIPNSQQQHGNIEVLQKRDINRKWIKCGGIQDRRQAETNSKSNKKISGHHDEQIVVNEKKADDRDYQEYYQNELTTNYSSNCHKYHHPSFSNEQYDSIKVNSPDEEKLREHEEMLKNINQLPQQLTKVRFDMLNQHEELNMIYSKVQKYSKQNFRKEKQLLDELIQKQEQLTKRQEQLNEQLEDMNRMKVQSQKISDQLLKSQLELQQAKRIQQITNENTKLYQQILKKNQQNPLRQAIPNITPGNHTHCYFQSEQKEISVLKSPYKYEQENDEEDNTLKELLSPLQINHDIDF